MTKAIVTEPDLRKVANTLSLEPVDGISWGWHNRSAGCAVADGLGRRFWLKVARDADPAEGDRAATWSASWKPRLLSSDRLPGGIFASVYEIALDPPIGTKPWLVPHIERITNGYLQDLSVALRSLGKVQTQRVNTRTDLVRRRLSECWALDLDPSPYWGDTIHGDLHWTNLTGPHLSILDWEGWGKGLCHQDVAFLVAFSGLYPHLCRRLCEILLPSDYDRRAFAFSLLFATAELLRMIDVYDDHPDLRQSLIAQGKNALAAL
jgi:hypothetical protein